MSMIKTPALGDWRWILTDFDFPMRNESLNVVVEEIYEVQGVASKNPLPLIRLFNLI